MIHFTIFRPPHLLQLIVAAFVDSFTSHNLPLSTYERVMNRAQSEIIFARTRLVLDLEQTLYLLPRPILRICGFRYIPAQRCDDGSISPPCVIRSVTPSTPDSFPAHFTWLCRDQVQQRGVCLLMDAHACGYHAGQCPINTDHPIATQVSRQVALVLNGVAQRRCRGVFAGVRAAAACSSNASCVRL